MKNRVLIVLSNYYEEIGNSLLKGAIYELESNKIEHDVIYAPGCFEIPLLISKNIKKYKGFIALGCVIRGETYHFEIISNECGRKIIDLSIEYQKPIGFGILTCDTYDQALIRSDPLQKNKGKEATTACIEILEYNLTNNE